MADPKKVEKDVRGLLTEADQIRGLGDVVHRATKALGIEECEPCEERRRKLNEKVPFRRRNGDRVRERK